MSIDTDDYDGFCDVYEVCNKRAAKDKRCDACHEIIRRGDLYCDTRMLYDGEWSDVARCARCEAMFLVIDDALPSGEVPDRELNCGHTWEERYEEPPPVEYQALAFLTPDEAQRLLLRLPSNFVGPREPECARVKRVLATMMSARESEQRVSAE
jgi:hypothetical protein